MQQYNKTIQKIINFDNVTRQNIRNHNTNWPKFLDHPYRILIIGGFEQR